MKVISSVHSPITAEFYAKNVALVDTSPLLQQFLGAIAEGEKQSAKFLAEARVLQYGLSRIAALTTHRETTPLTPIELRNVVTKVGNISVEIQNGLEDIARVYG